MPRRLLRRWARPRGCLHYVRTALWSYLHETRCARPHASTPSWRRAKRRVSPDGRSPNSRPCLPCLPWGRGQSSAVPLARPPAVGLREPGEDEPTSVRPVGERPPPHPHPVFTQPSHRVRARTSRAVVWGVFTPNLGRQRRAYWQPRVSSVKSARSGSRLQPPRRRHRSLRVSTTGEYPAPRTTRCAAAAVFATHTRSTPTTVSARRTAS